MAKKVGPLLYEIGEMASFSERLVIKYIYRILM